MGRNQVERWDDENDNDDVDDDVDDGGDEFGGELVLLGSSYHQSRLPFLLRYIHPLQTDVNAQRVD